MTISYSWLLEYLPFTPQPAELAEILTSLGLEVEGFWKYESVKGGLSGLVVGEVRECKPHPNADKLKLCTVDMGLDKLQIVCGAANVAVGQKVVVAPVGTTLFPTNGTELTIRNTRIRGIESEGMICAEDEIGIGTDHSGIVVLPPSVPVGTPAAEHFKPHSDWLYEIGLTPNRMDAMSHLGVARDVCAHRSHRDQQSYTPRIPAVGGFQPGNGGEVEVQIENSRGCRRYSGVSISGIKVKESPAWLRKRLLAIGQRPINNIVDITNYVLHETGQPLHAFDLKKISGRKIIVKNLPDGTKFITLDGNSRTLSNHDLMICDGNSYGMCIAGVFGGAASGVTEETSEIFLESAWFNPVDIRRTSFRHDLRTDAATHFEKNVDVSNTVYALKRAALMIAEIAEGKMSSGIVDVYPQPVRGSQITLKHDYLKKLSGKSYEMHKAQKILSNIGFEVLTADQNQIKVAVPTSKPDVELPADLVEEIMRIDGYDNIEIPSQIRMTPAIDPNKRSSMAKEKVASYLVGLGMFEIFTNSITNSAYYDSVSPGNTIRLINNLSVNHNLMRPSMLETGLEAMAYNLNRKNNDLKFFEFGKTYHSNAVGRYNEQEHLCLYYTGLANDHSWDQASKEINLFHVKGAVEKVLAVLGISQVTFNARSAAELELAENGRPLGILQLINKKTLSRFDIRQPVFFVDLDWSLLTSSLNDTVKIAELPKQLPVYRDLAIVVPSEMAYEKIKGAIVDLGIERLKDIKLFDVFESEKIGSGKKSLAISITFLDEEKTLSEKEIEAMMHQVISTLERNQNAEVRKS